MNAGTLLLAATLVLPGTCGAAGNPSEFFLVSRHSSDELVTIRFACSHAQNGGLQCETLTIAVGYYNQANLSPSQRDPKRCHVTASAESKTYEPQGLGRWVRSEVTGICRAEVRTEIVATSDGITVQDVTVSNPSGNSFDGVCKAWGSPGTTRKYSPATMFDVTKMQCTSLVVDP